MSTDQIDAEVIAPSLERAFKLPPHIEADPELTGLYEEIVSRLRNEASGIQMNTVQTLLLERIAYYYVDLKYKEENGQISLSNQKDALARWSSMTEQFNKMLVASSDIRRQKLLDNIGDLMEQIAMDIPDVKIRSQVLNQVAVGFKKLDI